MNAEIRCSSSIPRVDGQPKGVLHTTGGYMVYASMTHQYVFDYHGEIYWCTADVGWIPGTFLVCGPLTDGAVTLMFEGVHLSRRLAFLAGGRKHKVNIYTAPTAIRR